MYHNVLDIYTCNVTISTLHSILLFKIKSIDNVITRGAWRTDQWGSKPSAPHNLASPGYKLYVYYKSYGHII